ncbi:MAG: LptA/OstA family protein [bacterium]
MDDNLAWKIIFIGTTFSLIILGVAYYFISPQESEYFSEEKMEKIAEFKNTRVSGRKEGKKSWVLQAKYGWTDNKNEVTSLYDVTQGEIYKDETLVVKKLNAPFAKVYRRSEIVEAYAFPEGQEPKGKRQLTGYLNLGKIANPQNPRNDELTRLVANYLKYFPKEKKTEIKGKVEMHKKDSSIYAEEINVDNDKNIAYIKNNIRLVRTDGILYTESLVYDSKQEKLKADGNVTINIEENEIKTKVKADNANFSTDVSKRMFFSGHVRTSQGKKLAVADAAVYFQGRKELDLMGNAKAIFEKAEVILKDKTVDKLRNKEAKEMMREKTILTSNRLIISTWTGDATAIGSVEVTQQNKEARAEEAVYDDEKEIITLTGNAFMKKESSSTEVEWVQAKKIIVSVKDETFEAEGQVEAKIKI